MSTFPLIASMRLADFIEGNTTRIMAEWVAFAKESGSAGQKMDLEELADHAMAMLADIVTDLRTPQTDAEAVAKSKGNAPASDEADPETAAADHGAGRADSGFTIGQMASEYRALRASVVRLWTEECGSLEQSDLRDLVRFNEMIDQSLAESIEQYQEDIDSARKVFVAALGYDLRAPLMTVTERVHAIIQRGVITGPDLAGAKQISASMKRTNEIVADLLDFTWGELGSGIPLERETVDLGPLARAAMDAMCTEQTECLLQFTPSGELTGHWDGARVSQALSNLMASAVEHGKHRTLVSVTAHGDPEDVVVRVHYSGPVIPPDEIDDLFSPRKRFRGGAAKARDSGNLGLGLYIADRIIAAHGGSIDVRSSDEAGTLFTVRLPREDAKPRQR